MNLHVHSAHRQRKSLGCEHKKRVEKRWRITCADIRPGVYGPLVYPTTSKYFHQSSYYGPQIVQSAFDDDQGGLALFMLCGGIGLSTPSLHGKNTLSEFGNDIIYIYAFSRCFYPKQLTVQLQCIQAIHLF